MNSRWFEKRLDKHKYKAPKTNQVFEPLDRTMGAEYRFVPVGEFIEAAPLPLFVKGREKGSFISHLEPVVGGFSGRVTLQLEAVTPVLFGVKGDTPNLTVPAKLAARGGSADYCMPGRSSRGMIKSIYRIATFSALTPVNEAHRFGNRMPEYRQFVGLETVVTEETAAGSRERSVLEKPLRGWLVPKLEKVGGKYEIDHSGWLIFPEKPGLPASIPNAVINDALKAGEKNADWSRLSLNDRRKAIKKALGDGTFALGEGQHLIITGPMKDKKGEAVFGSPQTVPAEAIKVVLREISQFLISCSSYGKAGAAFPGGGKRKVEGNLAAAVADHARYLSKQKTDGEAKRHALLVGMGLNSDAWSPYASGLPGIPVYYYPASHGKNTKGLLFGTSEIFKIAHDHSVGDVLRRRPLQKPDTPPDFLDWTDALFGTIGEGEDDNALPAADGQKPSNRAPALASRVFFSFAPASQGAHSQGYYRVVQGAPKASYDPFYLAEPDPDASNTKRGTWDSETAVLSGHKRYPVAIPLDSRFEVPGEPDIANLPPPGKAEKMANIVQPLSMGTIFTLDIDFINLHPLELGGLLWALSFGDRTVFSDGTTTFCHVGGRLRGKGLGRLKPKVTALNIRQNPLPEAVAMPENLNMLERADALMLAFETDVGGRLLRNGGKDGSKDDMVEEFYGSAPISALVNMSDTEWKAEAEGDIGNMFSLPQIKTGETNFKVFIGLRKALYGHSGPYRSPQTTILDEFFETRKAPTRDPKADEYRWFDALRDPVAALRSYRKI